VRTSHVCRTALDSGIYDSATEPCVMDNQPNGPFGPRWVSVLEVAPLRHSQNGRSSPAPSSINAFVFSLELSLERARGQDLDPLNTKSREDLSQESSDGNLWQRKW